VRTVLLLAVLAGPAAAEETWILQTGPAAAESVPLKPVQPVDAWRGLYADGNNGIWVYATRSPNFFAPATGDVRRIAGTPWTVAVFFPQGWTPTQRAGWLDAWQTNFLTLSTMPQPGWPIVFPSVLKVPALTKS
jgi:hypothetical protein